MSHRIMIRATILSIALLSSAFAQEKAERYYKALRERPMNEQLFLRFFDAWNEEKEISDLTPYLQTGAEESWQGKVLLARYQIRIGQRAEALENLAAAVKEVPDNYAVRVMRGELLMRELDYQQAVGDLETVVKKSEDEEERLKATELLGKSYLRLDRVNDAIELWLVAITETDAGLDFVEAAAGEGEYVKAVELAKKLVEHTKDPYNKLRYTVRMGDLQALAGNHQEALETLSSALGSTGQESWIEKQILQTCDMILSRRGNLTEELKFYKNLEESYSQRAAVVKRYAYQLARNDQWNGAQERFQKLLQANPNDQELRREYIRLLLSGDKQEEALIELDKLMEQSGYQEALALEKVSLLRSMKRSEEVKAVLEEIKSKLSDSVSDLVKVGNLYLANDFKEEGEGFLISAMKKDNKYEAHMVLASYYLAESRMPEGAELLTEVAKMASLDITLQATKKLAAIDQAAQGYDLLKARYKDYGTKVSYLQAICQIGVSAKREKEVVPMALDLVNLAESYTDLYAAITLAGNVIERAGESDRVIAQIAESDAVQKVALQAYLYALGKDFDSAEGVLKPGVEAMRATETYLWSDLLLRKGDKKASCAVLERLVHTAEGKRTLYLKKLMGLQAQIGEYKKALETIGLWKSIAPEDKQAWIRESDMYNKLGLHEKGVQSLRRAIARFEDAEDLPKLLGDQYVRAQQYDQAYEVYWRRFEHALTDEAQLSWSQRLISFARQHNRLSDLMSRFKQRREDNPKSVVPVLAISKIFTAKGDFERERTYLKQALEMKPENLEWRLRLAELHEAIGDLDLATLTFAEAAEYDQRGKAASREIEFYLRTGQPEKAISKLEALKGTGSDPRESESLAQQFLGRDYWTEATTILKRALAEHPTDARLHYLLGSIYEDDQRYDQAVSHFKSVYQHAQLIAPAPSSTTASSASGSAQLQVLPAGHYSGTWSRYPTTHSINNSPGNTVPGDLQSLLPQLASNHYTVYQRNFNPQQASRLIINIPPSPDLLQLYTHNHMLTLLGLVEDDAVVRAELEAHGLKDVEMAQDYYQAVVKARYTGQEIDFLSFIKKYPDNELFYQLSAYSGRYSSSIPVESHLTALKKFSGGMPYHAALQLIIAGEKAEHLEAVNAFFQEKRAEQKESETPDPHVLYVLQQVLNKGKSKRTPEELSVLRDMALELAEEQFTINNGESVTRLVLPTFLEYGGKEQVQKALVKLISFTQPNAGKSAPQPRALQGQSSSMFSQAVSSLREGASLLNLLNYQMSPLGYHELHQGAHLISSTSHFTKEEKDAILRGVLKEQDSPLFRLIYAQMSEQKEEARTILTELVDKEGVNQQYYRARYIMELKDSGREEELLKSAEKFEAWFPQNDPHSPLIDAVKVLIVSAIDKQKRKPYLPLAEAALKRLHTGLKAEFKATPAGSAQYYERFLIERGAHLGIIINPDLKNVAQNSPLNPVTGQGVQSSGATAPATPKVKTAMQAIMEANNKPREERVKAYLAAGKKDEAHQLAVRLLIREWEQNSRYNNHNRQSRLVQYFDELNMMKDIVPSLKEKSPKSAYIADQIATLINYHQSKDEAQKYMRNYSGYSAYELDVRMRMMYPDGSFPEGYEPYLPREAKEVKVVFPSFAYHSRELFIQYIQQTLRAISGLEGGYGNTATEAANLARIAHELNNQQYFKNGNEGQRISALFGSGEKDPFMKEERIASTQEVTRLLLQSRNAHAGFVLATFLEQHGHGVEGDRFSWMRSFLLHAEAPGIAGTSPYQQNIHNQNYQLNQFIVPGATLEELLCLNVREGLSEAFPETFREALKQENPGNSKTLETLISMTKMNEAQFIEARDKLAKGWNLPQLNSQSLFQSYGGRLYSAMPLLQKYTRKMAQKDADEISEGIAKLAPNDYQKAQELSGRANQLITRINHDLTPADMEAPFLQIHQGYLKAKKNDTNQRHYAADQFQQGLMTHLNKNNDLISALVYPAWKNKIGFYQAMSSITQKQRMVNASWETDKLDENFRKLGYFNELADFYPLVYMDGGGNSSSARHALRQAYGNLSSTEAGEAYISHLKSKKEHRFGAYIVAAHISSNSEQRSDLLKQALTEHADALMKLEDDHLTLIFGSFQWFYHYTQAYGNSPQLDRVLDRLGKIHARHLKHQIEESVVKLEELDLLAARNSLSRDLGQYASLSRSYFKYDPVGALDIHQRYAKVIDKINAFSAANPQATLNMSSSYAPDYILSSLLNSLYSFPMEKQLTLFPEIMKTDAVKASKDLLDKTLSNNVNRFVDKFISEKRKVLDENGKHLKSSTGSYRYKTLMKWEEIVMVEAELGQVFKDAPQTLSRFLLEKYASSRNDFYKAPPEVLNKWLEIKPETELEATVSLLANMSVMRSNKDKQLKKETVDQIMRYLDQYSPTAQSKLAHLKKFVRAGDWGTESKPLYDLAVKCYRETLSPSTLIGSDAYWVISLFASNEAEELRGLSEEVLSLWVEKAKELPNNNEVNANSYYCRNFTALSMRLREHEPIKILLNITGEKSKKEVIKYLQGYDLNSIKADASQEFITFINTLQEEEKKAVEARVQTFIQRLEKAEPDLMDRNARLKISNESKAAILEASRSSPEVVVEIFRAYQTLTDKHYAIDKTLSETAKSGYQHPSGYDAYGELLGGVHYDLRRLPVNTRLQLYAKLAADRDSNAINHYIYTKIQDVLQHSYSKIKVEEGLGHGHRMDVLTQQWSWATEEEAKALNVGLLYKLFRYTPVSHNSSRQVRNELNEKWQKNEGDSLFIDSLFLLSSVNHHKNVNDAVLVERLEKILSAYKGDRPTQLLILSKALERNWFRTQESVNQLFCELSLEGFAEFGPAHHTTYSTLEYFSRGTEVENANRKQYFESWLKEVSQDMSVLETSLNSSSRAKTILKLALIYNESELVEFLMTKKKDYLLDSVAPVVNLIAEGEYEMAKSLITQKKIPLKYDDFIYFTFSAEDIPEDITRLWEVWKESPMESLIVVYSLFAHDIGGVKNKKELYEQLVTTFWELEKELPEAVRYELLGESIKPLYYTGLDAQRLEPYSKPLTREEYNKLGFSQEHYFLRTKLRFDAVIARERLLKGDPAGVLKLYKKSIGKAENERRALKDASFLRITDAGVRQLLVRDRATLEKYYEMIKNEIPLALNNQDQSRFTEHVVKQRLLVHLNLYGELDLEKVFPEVEKADLPLLKKRISGIDSQDYMYDIDRAFWNSDQNEKVRHHYIRSMARINNFLLSNKIVEGESREDRFYFFENLSRDGVDLITLSEDASIPEELQYELKHYGMRTLPEDFPSEKLEPLFLELRDYYKEKDEIVYDLCLNAFLLRARQNDTQDLLEKYARGTRYERRYFPQERKPGDGSFPFFKMETEGIKKALQTVALNDQGLPKGEGLEDLFMNSPSINNLLNYIDVSAPGDLNKNIIKRVKENRGVEVKQRIMYTVYLKPGITLNNKDLRPLRAAFNEYHLELDYKAAKSGEKVLGNLRFIFD